MFLGAVNVGGANRCQPALIATQLSKFGVINIGTVGTFLVRRCDRIDAARRDRLQIELLTGRPGSWFDNRPSVSYMALQYMASPVPDRELKKGSAELMILSLLEDRARHGYEIAQLIELRSRGAIRFNVASLYPLLYRLEKRTWIRGRWVERPGQRRRRYYRLTASGKNVLSKQRAGWREFVEAINLITGIQHA